MPETTDAPKSYWFVGASYGRTEDQTPRFLSEGIWENGYDDKHLDLVRSMQPGDRIAIKLRVPRDDGHLFHGMMGTDSTRRWAVIPRDRGQV